MLLSVYVPWRCLSSWLCMSINLSLEKKKGESEGVVFFFLARSALQLWRRNQGDSVLGSAFTKILKLAAA